MSLRTKLLLGLTALLMLLGVATSIKACRARKAAAVATTQAAQAGTQGALDESHAQGAYQAAQQLQPVIVRDDTAVAAAHAEVERLRAALAVALQQAPVQDPAREALIAAQATENAAQATEIQDLKARGADLEAAYTAQVKATGDYKAQAASLQVANDLLRRAQRPWAAGASVGTDSSKGVWAERDLGPVRVGVDVIRRPATGGSTTLEAIARVGWRF